MTLRLAPPSHALINQSPPPSFISPRPPLRREGRAGQCWLAGLLICSPAIPSYIIRAELRFFLFSFFNLVPLSRIHRHLRPSWTNKGDIMHENHLDIHRCPSPNLRLFGNHSFDRPLFFSFSSFHVLLRFQSLCRPRKRGERGKRCSDIAEYGFVDATS